MGGLFKGPKPQKSESGNRAYEEIEHYFQPTLGYTSQAGDMMASLLGVGAPRVGSRVGQYTSEGGGAGGGAGGAGQTSALENWANSGGMQFLREQGNRQINSNQAAKGLLNSGSTLTALTKYGQGLGSTYLNQYMDQLGKLAGIGLGAGNLMAGAGQWSKGQGAQPAGAGKQLGQMIATAAISCDPRLKYDSKVVGYLPDGLPIHEFRYRQDTPLNLPTGKFIGVMADEVATLRPEALGGTRKGYQMLRDKSLAPRKVSE